MIGNIGRVQNVKNNATSANYASSAGYNATSQLTGFTYGNGVGASFGYSSTRLQLSSVAYTQGGGNLFSLSYGYSQSGANNGQIASVTDNVDGGRTATYGYDARRRLATAGTSGSGGYAAWGLSWTYDDYGNRTDQSVTAGSGPANSVSVSTSTNRITGMGGYTFYYDSSGNLTQDDLYKFKYDAEHRLVEIRNLSNLLISSYAFDGHSLRVIKVWGADRTWYLYAGSQLVSEFEDAASATYSAGTQPGGAGSDSTATMLYQHGDHLTTRLTTDNSGQLSNQQAHYPYGEQWYAGGGADPSVERKFTTYLRDGEVATGRLNYAVFREHSARVARFLTPDPLQIKGRAPQRLNRYSYVANEPIGRTDHRGLDWDIDITIGGGGGVGGFPDLGGGSGTYSGDIGLRGDSGGGADMFAICPIFSFLPGKMDICPVSGGGGGGGGNDRQQECQRRFDRCMSARNIANRIWRCVNRAREERDFCLEYLCGDDPTSPTDLYCRGKCHAEYSAQVDFCNISGPLFQRAQCESERQLCRLGL